MSSDKNAIFTDLRLFKVLKSFIWNILRLIRHSVQILRALRYLFLKRTKDRKTVFFIANSITGGGAERVAAILASELSSCYHAIVICSVKSPSKSRYPLSPNVDLIYLPFYILNDNTPNRFLSGFTRLIKRRQNAFASVSLVFNSNALNISSRANDKVICCERNNPLKHERDKERFELIQSIYERADHVVFQSSIVRDLFSEKVREHCSILPNPISVTCCRKAETRHRIVTCGRLHAQKNHPMLIRAFHRFSRIHPEYTLSIYGKGFMQSELQELIDSLSLQNSVFLEGRSTHIHEDIADAELFVLSSDYEGLSNALLEAMMMGFPCISTDCEGSTDVIENGVNGLLVSRGSEEELLSAMLYMAEHETLREEMGQKAMQTAQRFKREKVAEEWKNMIETV